MSHPTTNDVATRMWRHCASVSENLPNPTEEQLQVLNEYEMSLDWPGKGLIEHSFILLQNAHPQAKTVWTEKLRQSLRISWTVYSVIRVL